MMPEPYDQMRDDLDPYRAQFEAMKAEARRSSQQNYERARQFYGQSLLEELGGLKPGLKPAPAPSLPKAFMAGPIIGWRLWKIREPGILTSVVQAQEWPSGTPTMGSPKAGGSYGVYAMKQRESLMTGEYGKECVIGQVALWGTIIEHELGYRAQYAYPLMIDLSVVPPMPGFPVPLRRARLAEAIVERYGCVVMLGNPVDNGERDR